jgi:hypothetical protein
VPHATFTYVSFAAMAVCLVFAPAAAALAPTLLSVREEQRHPVATFSAPGADDATIYLSTKPDRATDGRFLEENIADLDFLTADEIQAGRWLYESQLDPGLYYAMLRASDDDCAGEPGCTEGFSNVVTLQIPKPARHYSARVHAYRYLSSVDLTLRIAPLGERVPYRVCWKLVTGRQRCVHGTVQGNSWNDPAEDQVSVRKRGMPKITRFAWYVGKRKVASRRARIPRA